MAATDGTVLVYDDFLADLGAVAAGNAAPAGPDRVITPTDGGGKVSVDLHGVVHVADRDTLLLSDVGDAASDADGQLFVLAAASASGDAAVAARIAGPASTLGNPVDLAFDGRHLYVAEKTKDTVLRFDDILPRSGSRDAAPDRSVAVDNPESVALAPSSLSDPR